MEFTNENILRVINKNINSKYSDWFILVRSNRQIEEIYSYLTKNNIPCDTFKQSELDSK